MGDEIKDTRGNDDQFYDNLDAGNRTVWLVGRWVYRMHRNIEIYYPPVTVRGNVHARAAHSDDGTDMKLNGYRIQVKSRSYDFTSLSDLKFPDLIVADVDKWDGYVTKYDFMVTVNRARTAALVVPADSSPVWRRDWTPDRLHGGEHEVYYAPKTVIHSLEWLVDWIATHESKL